MSARNQAIHTLFKNASEEVHNLKTKPSDAEFILCF